MKMESKWGIQVKKTLSGQLQFEDNKSPVLKTEQSLRMKNAKY